MIIGLLLEIEGFDTAWVASTGIPNPPTQWGQSVVEGLSSIPPIQKTGVDPYTGSFNNGGMGVAQLDMSTMLWQRSEEPRAKLDADLTDSATTITVDSTTGFSSSGTVWIRNEAINYTGTTATTFTGCTRGSLGTDAEAIPTGVSVFGFPRKLIGRRCYLSRFGDVADRIVFIGRVDNINFSDGVYELDIINWAQDLELESIGSATGRTARLITPIPADPKGINSFDISIEAESLPNSSGRVGYCKIDNEIIKFLENNSPAYSEPTIGIGLSSAGVGDGFTVAGTPLPPLVGDAIRFIDAVSGDTINTKIVSINKVFGTGYEVYHSAVGKNPSLGGTVETPYRQTLAVLTRAQLNTDAEEHQTGAEVKSVFWIEGDTVDMVLSLLISGSGSGGIYDTLTSLFGAGIPSSFFDIDSFDSIRPYSLPRGFLIEEPVTPKQLLTDLAKFTGGRIFTSIDGQIKARREFSAYPDNGAEIELNNTDHLIAGTYPNWRKPRERGYNAAKWMMLEGTVHFGDDEDIEVNGRQELPEQNMKSYPVATSLSTVSSVVLSLLERFSLVPPELSFSIPHEEETELEPGQLISVNMPHIPNETGSDGISEQLWEVLEYSPQEGERVNIKLLRLPERGRVGLVAPAARVQAWGTDWIVVSAESVTHYAADRQTPFLEDIRGASRDGTEDIDWFLEGDILRLWDESTYGGTVVSSQMVVDSIDYTARKITFTAAVPAWIAIDDLLVFDNYTATSGGPNASLRTEYFAALADSSGLVGSDDPYDWGM